MAEKSNNMTMSSPPTRLTSGQTFIARYGRAIGTGTWALGDWALAYLGLNNQNILRAVGGICFAASGILMALDPLIAKVTINNRGLKMLPIGDNDPEENKIQKQLRNQQTIESNNHISDKKLADKQFGIAPYYTSVGGYETKIKCGKYSCNLTQAGYFLAGVGLTALAADALFPSNAEDPQLFRAFTNGLSGYGCYEAAGSLGVANKAANKVALFKTAKEKIAPVTNVLGKTTDIIWQKTKQQMPANIQESFADEEFRGLSKAAIDNSMNAISGFHAGDISFGVIGLVWTAGTLTAITSRYYNLLHDHFFNNTHDLLNQPTSTPAAPTLTP